MTYVLGIDVGTSYTAAAISRCENHLFAPPQVMNLGGRGGTVPSVIFVASDGELSIGDIAERRGVRAPERLVREFKRRLGDSIPVVIEDESFTPEFLFASVVRWVVDQAEEREGEPPEGLTVSHPVEWGEYRTDLIRQALSDVGLGHAELLSEPEAAALYYASHERVADGSTIAVYDLGGGTFDAAVLRKSSDQAFVSLGTPVGIERLGGADFDDLVFRHVVANTPGLLEHLDMSEASGHVLLARLRRECVEAKEILSSDTETTVQVLLPNLQNDVRLVRSEFEEMIEEQVGESVDALRRVMRTAELEAADLDAILLIGGSSRIPLIAQTLSAELGRPIAIDADPKASISLGAAFAAAALIEVIDDDSDEHPVQGLLPAVSGHPVRRRPAAAAFVRAEPAAAVGASHPRGRTVAIAAAAALLVTLTATAAQSPTGINAIASVLAQGGVPDGASTNGSDGRESEESSTDDTSGAAQKTASSTMEEFIGIANGSLATAPTATSTGSAEAGRTPTSDPTGSPVQGPERDAKGPVLQSASGSIDPVAPTTDPAPASPPAEDANPNPATDPLPVPTDPSTDPTTDPLPDPITGPTTDPTPDPTTGPTADPLPDPTPGPTTETPSEPAIGPTPGASPIPSDGSQAPETAAPTPTPAPTASLGLTVDLPDLPANP
ncbi:Hsp70 family protein [Arthrobacter sp. NamB2]|uniref:Hsp70 family protein n=1 Tax=Arthrobacter sp. NamB2 TaxID=2576035 RepID=UPI0010CA0785|nr:Hsp70 family protein [Arthrobacter sp. NamB2]TKV27826.1 Hsp70 family protein [Arthrobacter sp. NamB2]